jgi:hypothetical protein
MHAPVERGVRVKDERADDAPVFTSDGRCGDQRVGFDRRQPTRVGRAVERGAD